MFEKIKNWSKRNKRLVVILCILFFLLVVFIGVGYFGIYRRQITEKEKELLLKIDDFPFTYKSRVVIRSDLCQRYIAKTNFDLTLELEYTYDSELNKECSTPLYLKSEAEINHSEGRAKEAFFSSIGAYKLGASLVKGRVLEENKYSKDNSLGDNFYSAIIRDDRTEVGNIVVIRQGKIIHSLILIGLYIDDPQDFKDIFGEILERSEKYK